MEPLTRYLYHMSLSHSYLMFLYKTVNDSYDVRWDEIILELLCNAIYIVCQHLTRCVLNYI